MTRCFTIAPRLRGLLLCATVALPLAAQADPVPRDVFFGGQGSLVFDASTGMGAWLGSIDEAAFPVVAMPLSLFSSVSFLFNSATGLLTGSFEMTLADDFSTTLNGLIDGELLQGGFDSGGQLAINYSILGGSGDFLRANGFGLSFVDFGVPDSGFYAYTEAGVLSFAVPEPGTLALMTAGLLAVALGRRKWGPVNLPA